ncbi:MAG: hypothetical protein ACP5JJ_10995 [Anaerolineae bacterium]
MTACSMHALLLLVGLTLLFLAPSSRLLSLRAPRSQTRGVPDRQPRAAMMALVTTGLALLASLLLGCGTRQVVYVLASPTPTLTPLLVTVVVTAVPPTDTAVPLPPTATPTPLPPTPTNTQPATDTPTPLPSPTDTLTPTPRPSPKPTSPPTATPPPPFRPPTGMLEDHTPGGQGELLIKNGTDADALVILTGLNDKPVKSAYIRNTQSFNMTGIVAGTYRLYYSKGEAFDRETNRFTKNATYQRLDATLEFTASATQYTTWEVTLYGVAGGNVGSVPVDPSQFP